MAKPTTKKELLNIANKQYQKLLDLINSMSKKDQEKKFSFYINNETGAHWKRDQNIKDIFIHLYEWHQLLLNWINCNVNSIPKQFLLEGYNWKTYGDMNIEFWKKHLNTPYSDSIKMLDQSHRDVIKRIDNFSDEELFKKGTLQWTGSSTLGQYCISATSGHYDWAIKKIKKHIENLK